MRCPQTNAMNEHQWSYKSRSEGTTRRASSPEGYVCRQDDLLDALPHVQLPLHAQRWRYLRGGGRGGKRTP